MNNNLTKITEWLTAITSLLISQRLSLYWFSGSRQRLNTFNRLPSITIDSISGYKTSRIYGISWSIYRWKLNLERTYRTYFQKNCSLHWHLDEKQVFCSFRNTLTWCIYNALVQLHFDYCSVVWGNWNKSLSIKLQKLQNRAARILTSSSYDAAMQRISLLDLAGENLIFNEN